MKRDHKFAKEPTVLWMIIAAMLGIFPCTAVADKTNTTKPACCTDVLRTAPATNDASLYQIDSTWTTDAGKRIKLSSLIGRPHIITMFFAHCEYACPILANDMRRLEAALPHEIRTNVGFTLITFDTERDTPEALAKYRQSRSIPDHWMLLTAKADDVLELSQLLGVKFKKDARGQFSHSNIITILNPQGEIAFQHTGLNREPTEGVTVVKRLLERNADVRTLPTAPSDTK